MEFGNFRGFEVSLRDPGIAWVRFNQPELLNGMTHHLKRDLREALLQAPVRRRRARRRYHGLRPRLLRRRRHHRPRDQLRRRRPAPRRPHRQRPPQPHGDLLRPAHDLPAAQQGRAGVGQDHHRRRSTASPCRPGSRWPSPATSRIAAESARLTSGTLRFGLLPDEGRPQAHGAAHGRHQGDGVLPAHAASPARRRRSNSACSTRSSPTTSSKSAAWPSPPSSPTAPRSRCACSSARCTTPTR